MTSTGNCPEFPIPPVADVDSSPTEVPRLDTVLATQEHRRRAEQVFRQQATEATRRQRTMSPEESRRVLHELGEYQIELEIQNEELRRAQFELEASRARYFNLYDLAPVGYCTISGKGLILEANLTAANLLGATREELTAQSISGFICKGHHITYYLLYRKLFATGMPQAGELKLVRKDGTSFWAHLETTIALDDSGIFVSRVMLSDITNRKCSEKALQESNRQNLEILNSITDAFISLSDDEVVTYFNAAAERMFKKKRKDILGRKLFDVFPQAKGTILEENFAKALRTKSPLSFQVLVTQVPYENWYAVRVYPSREGITIYFQVITEHKQAEAEKVQLESLNRQIQKSESLARMAGAIAHHFNNKLQIMQGSLELAIAGLRPDDPSLNKLTNAMQAADEAAEMSRMMLTYLGQTDERQEPFNLSEFCRAGLPTIKAAMPKNVAMDLHLESPGPTIKANAKQMQQILVHLVTNAWEALREEQGKIDLTVKTIPREAISSAYRFPANWQPGDDFYACLEVRDNGCGIADKDLEEVFSPFFSTKFTGRGMGLPIVLGLTQAHHGVVTAESQQGQGSVFRVFLPISHEEIVQQPLKELVAPAVTHVLQEPGKVLLVDDDQAILELTSVMLSTLGFSVLKAKDGIEALEIFTQHKDAISFVLSDVAMPRMNGWETLLALRQIVPGIPVILASGYSEEQVLEEPQSERPQSFLGKPYGFQALSDAISRALADNNEPKDVGQESLAEGEMGVTSDV